MDKSEQIVTICPKCKSPNVSIDKSNPVQPSFGLPPIYLCKKCGHTGTTFPEVPLSQLESFETEAQKEGLIDTTPDDSAKVDTRYGIFEVRFLWKISSLLIVALGIYLLFRRMVVVGIVITILGLIMFYITYFKKRKIKVFV